MTLAGEGGFLWERIGARVAPTPAAGTHEGSEIVLIGTAPIILPPLAGIAER